ncbi:tRNA-dihydrouridine synthase [Desulfonema limicola]|uniref:tRNA-dihydrouridine synthase n=1 Tax=Desulfonema limicola TaxID=45656 RepID=A0A975BE43_9BACT|nr:tRNA-dihydrouridine synthase family protein [Desulfonema limicola]QTA83643.1 tRNA-dihydrouridine synthase [Desulfonema limicola]
MLKNMKPILYLAPMRGITNFTFRNVFYSFFQGFDLAVAPFISGVNARRIKDSYFKDVLPVHNQEIPVIPQILTKSPEDFIFMAKRLYDLGHETINWNLGCPFAMVAKKGRGSGLLPHPELIDLFLEKVIPAVPNNLSIKTRLGRNNPDEIFALMPVFNRYPLTELIIHPRTGIQMYEGVPDLNIFEECLDMSAHAVVYNGDIIDIDTFQRLSSRFKSVNRWMIGRGALINPFLPGMIKAGCCIFNNKISIFKDFHEALFHAFDKVLDGPSHLLKRMKSFWDYFEQSFNNSRQVVKKIRKNKDIEQYRIIVHDFLEKEAKWTFDKQK